MPLKKLTTEHLILRPPRKTDGERLKKFQEINEGHLARWESTSNESLESAMDSYKERLASWIKECKEGKSARFFLLKKDDPDGDIIGTINFTQIFHGPFQACYLGYKIDRKFEGKGLMYESLSRSIRYVFEDLHLHRIMANYMPSNDRSANLLRRLGFSIEGYAENYLLINHRWEDHVLTALTYEKWKILNDK